MTTKGSLGNLLKYIKKWAGVDEDDALFCLNPKDMNNLSDAIKLIQEGTVEKVKQEKEYKESLEKAKGEPEKEEKEYKEALAKAKEDAEKLEKELKESLE